MHSHSHTHTGAHTGHSHAPSHFGKAFAFGATLNALFVISEVVFGLRAHSTALLADAGHNLSDVLSLLLAWGATVLAVKPASRTLTYGFRSTSILAALFNSCILLVAIGAIGWEAVLRIWSPEVVHGGIVAWVAAFGILINGSVALLFMSGRKDDLNVRAAFMHLAADALMAFAVLVGGILITLTHQPLIDPILSLLIVVVILFSTWSVFKEALRFSMQGVPPGLKIEEVRECLEKLEGVEAVHDLHVWGMSTTEVALTAHLVAPRVKKTDDLLKKAGQILHETFDIHHVTLQIEQNDPCCEDCRGPV